MKIYREVAAAAGVSLLLLTGCGQKRTATPDTVDTLPAQPKVEEVFHANNDIAMTVRSLVDAIRQSEPLDTATYNFEGVLTDGSGAALYINAVGDPGRWRVRVGDAMAVIENLELGKFDPDAVRAYVCDELGLSDDDILKRGVVKGPGGVDQTNYGFEGGEVHFETERALTSDGKEGPLLTIKILSLAE